MQKALRFASRLTSQIRIARYLKKIHNPVFPAGGGSKSRLTCALGSSDE